MTTTSQLAVGVAGVWRFDLDGSRDEIRLTRLLAPDERSRAARFRFDRDRARFVVGRARLRQVLAELTGVPAADLELATNPYGKPELPGTDLYFNLTHAGGTGLLAVTTVGPVGVDLEPLAPVPDRDTVAERFFSQREVFELRRLSPGVRDAAFLRCWTRKEAYVKAVGGGLSLGLQDFAVSLGVTERPAIVWAADPAVVDRWSVSDLSAYCPGHVAALVLHGPAPILSYRGAATGTESR